MSMNKLVAAVLSLASLIGILFAIDARYLHVEAAEQLLQGQLANLQK